MGFSSEETTEDSSLRLRDRGCSASDCYRQALFFRGGQRRLSGSGEAFEPIVFENGFISRGFEGSLEALLFRRIQAGAL